MFSVVRILLIGGLVGKFLGVVRELFSAWAFGVGVVSNSFRLSQAAFLIPLHGFLSDAVNSGFSPVYSRLRVEDPLSATRLFLAVHWAMVALSLVVAVFIYLFAPSWVSFLAPGFDEEAMSLSVDMVRVLVFAMPAYGAVAVCGAAELCSGSGRIASMRASVQSVGLIIGTLAAWSFSAPVFIAVGFLLSYIFLAVFGWFVLHKDGVRLVPIRGDLSNGMHNFFLVLGSVRLLLLVPISIQLYQIVEKRVASTIDPSVISALDYSRFISETAILLLAMPFGMAGLSSMAVMSEREFAESAWKSVRAMFFVGIPSSMVLVVNSEYLVRVLFLRGAFSQQGVAFTAELLSGLAIGLPFQLVGYACLKFLSARGRNRVVVAVTVCAVLFSVLVNLTVVESFGIKALAFSLFSFGFFIGIGSIVSIGLLRRSIVEYWPLFAAGFFLWAIKFSLGEGGFFWLMFSAISSAVLLFAVPRYREYGLSLLRAFWR